MSSDAGDGSGVRGVADAVFEVLRRWGVDRVFICPGSTEAAFLDASLRNRDVRMVLVTHEAVAVSMADGYARATGRPAAVYLHTNVGLTNALSHLYCAWLDRVPILVLNGLKPTSIQAAGGFTTAPSVRDMVRQYTKWDWQTLRGETVAEDVNRALKVAATIPMGPTYVAVPQDFFELRTSVSVPDVAGYRVSGEMRPDPDLVAKAVELLAGSRRPLLVAGEEVGRSGSVEELVRLAERACAPVVTEERRTFTRLAFPANHDNFCGFFDPNLELVKTADVILLLGARTPLTFDPKQGPVLPPGVRLVHLYSDPAELGKCGPVTVPLVGTARLAISELVGSLDMVPHEQCAVDRARHVRAARDAYLDALGSSQEGPDPEGTLSVTAAMNRLAESLGPDPIVVEDSTTSATAVRRSMLRRGHIRGLFSSSGGSLGWGAGAALGMQLAEPDAEVVFVMGDGGLHFAFPTLATAIAEGLPVTMVIVNNSSYAAVKAALIRYGGEAASSGVFPGSDISGPDYAAIAQGFGVRGIRVSDLDGLSAAVESTHTDRRPTLVEVMTKPDDPGPI